MKLLTPKLQNKKYIFLIDAVGALISGILLFFVIGNLESVFGMPTIIAKKLAILPFLFCIFSLSCHLIRPKSGIYLRIISVLNLIYCLISIVLVVYFFDEIKPLGFTYFISEKLIVIPLAVWEWKVSFKS